MEDKSIIKEFCEAADGSCTVRVIDTDARFGGCPEDIQKIQCVVVKDFNELLPISFDNVITAKDNDKIFGAEFKVPSKADVPEEYKKVATFKVG